ncbi:Chitin elicitor-binding protein, partial [Ananas comosus]
MDGTACSSSISSTSIDRNLRVPNGSYILTANNCVLCSCSSSSWQLDCHPTQGISSSTCPAAMCGNMYLGNTSSSSPCERATCAYTGYTNKTSSFAILTNLTIQSLCNTSGAPPLSQPTSGAALRLGLQGVKLTELLIFFHIALLCLAFLSR